MVSSSTSIFNSASNHALKDPFEWTGRGASMPVVLPPKPAVHTRVRPPDLIHQKMAGTKGKFPFVLGEYIGNPTE